MRRSWNRIFLEIVWSNNRLLRSELEYLDETGWCYAWGQPGCLQELWTLSCPHIDRWLSVNGFLAAKTPEECLQLFQSISSWSLLGCQDCVAWTDWSLTVLRNMYIKSSAWCSGFCSLELKLWAFSLLLANTKYSSYQVWNIILSLPFESVEKQLKPPDSLLELTFWCRFKDVLLFLLPLPFSSINTWHSISELGVRWWQGDLGEILRFLNLRDAFKQPLMPSKESPNFTELISPPRQTLCGITKGRLMKVCIVILISWN